jgi:hypothetical protein
MIVHRIHDLSDLYVVEFLKRGIATCKDSYKYVNFHPDYSLQNSNLFYLLDSGRYAQGRGKYFIIEDDGQYVCSAGWNEYDYDSSIALALTRMYVNPSYRAQYFAGKHILPVVINETSAYNRVWITCNEHNKMIYNWFDRANQGKRTALYSNWPGIYNRFRPVGVRDVYFTKQYVVELDRTRND